MTYKATIYQSPPGAEIFGGAVMGIFHSLESDVLNPIMAKYGLTPETFDAGAWYPMQLFYDVLREASQQSFTAGVAIGKAV
ncbi:MAG: hypothetical protein GYB67_10695, partial [Chloroflexi bacterium]|nr:hypothetical protein [Chloroflexota bacterium]